MDAFPKHYIVPRIPDVTLNQFRESLSVEGMMEMDKLIRWQHQREIRKMNSRDDTTRKFFDGMLEEEPDQRRGRNSKKSRPCHYFPYEYHAQPR